MKTQRSLYQVAVRITKERRGLSKLSPSILALINRALRMMRTVISKDAPLSLRAYICSVHVKSATLLQS
jgi:hypothetical protein